MADDRMKDNDLRNMGKAGEGEDFGKDQQTPGRNPQGDQQTGGQRRGGQQNFDDDDFDTGKKNEFDTGNQSGTQNRGGQNR